MPKRLPVHLQIEAAGVPRSTPPYFGIGLLVLRLVSPPSLFSWIFVFLFFCVCFCVYLRFRKRKEHRAKIWKTGKRAPEGRSEQRGQEQGGDYTKESRGFHCLIRVSLLLASLRQPSMSAERGINGRRAVSCAPFGQGKSMMSIDANIQFGVVEQRAGESVVGTLAQGARICEILKEVLQRRKLRCK